MNYFSDFKQEKIQLAEVELFACSAGEGPPLLLLHGFPESHLCWWRIAPELAKHYHVIVPDLRGYGNSGLPHLRLGKDKNHYSKRETGKDLLDLMAHFAYQEFSVVAHDRGARVAHRLCLDFPKRVKQIAFLDIIPSLAMADNLNHDLAMAYFHQTLLAQPSPFPETLFAGKESFFIQAGMAAFSGGDTFPADILTQYTKHLADPERFFAMCEDYRAAATIDLELDREDQKAGKKLQQDCLVMWGGQGRLGQVMDVAECWQPYIDGDFITANIDCGHFMPEEAPEECLRALKGFLQ